MKTLVQLLGALMLFSTGFSLWSQNPQPTTESINSFYSALEGIKWKAYEDKSAKTSSCEPMFKKMIGKMKDPTYKKNGAYNKVVKQLNDFTKLIKSTSENFNLNENYPGRRLAKLYHELGRRKDLSSFQYEFKFDATYNEQDLSNDEKEALENQYMSRRNCS